ncbi:YfcE family phosphodiesterase [Terrilactibacillus sp. BCM23-1]|uniref:YfcE family phosphodiesterase n=1 Tax=Terrilactibacillus tamarindi TaxID=2599694 RepID=A0A6N8CQR6_9BACI|nr:metallophosphoesterase family protein [Terrilactibacillus tamarindi]MTT31527.1 YfcE family phosphodiesterase [Terrilactibacillus tamarindi]
MRIALISDIHGNAVALDAVLEDVKKQHVDQIFVLGDLCFRGPEPKRALERVRSLDTVVIKGNADEWIVRGVKQGEVPDHMLSIMKKEQEWGASKLDEDDLNYLSHLPTGHQLQVDDSMINLFHATPESLFEVVPSDSKDDVLYDRFHLEGSENVYVYAHIHTAFIRFIKGNLVMNTGSVGLPFDGVAKASYGLLDMTDGNISGRIIKVPYDIEKVVKQYQSLDYPNAEMMINTIRQGRLG